MTDGDETAVGDSDGGTCVRTGIAAEMIGDGAARRGLDGGHDAATGGA